ncbi:DNA-binding transcriptional regulator, MarR family [Burkholderia sp. GAS332]|nr:DNA-binding transcriptional regulator, MarR family [Burkholderia sp. GAS332]
MATDKSKRGFDLDSYLFFWIGQIDRLYARSVTKALKPFDVNLTCWRILALLHRMGSLTTTELSDMSAIERSALGRTVDTMQASGLIRKVGRSDDQRMQDVEILEAGTRLYLEILPIVKRINDHAIWNVSAADLDRCISILKDVRSNLS